MKHTNNFRSRQLQVNHTSANPKSQLQQKKYQKQSDQYFELGCKYLGQEKLLQSINCLSKCIQLNPNHYKAYCNIGVAYKKQKLYRQARESYLSSLLLKQNDQLTYYNLGNLQKFLTNYQQAVKYYQTCLYILQQSKSGIVEREQNQQKLQMNCLINLGVTYKNMEQIHKAIHVNDKIIQLFPNIEQGYFNKAMCIIHIISHKNVNRFMRTKQGLCDNAIQLLEKSLIINPSNIYFKLAIIQCKYLKNNTIECYKSSINQLQSLKKLNLTQHQITKINSNIKNCNENINIIQNSFQSQYQESQFSRYQPIAHNRLDQRNYRISDGKKRGHSIVQSQASYNSQIVQQFQEFDEPLKKQNITFPFKIFTTQIQNLMANKQYLQAIKITQKMQQSLQRDEKLIILQFLLALEKNSDQIYTKTFKLYNQQIGKHNFASIKNKISIIGHQLFGYMMKFAERYQQSIQYYKYLVQYMLGQMQKDPAVKKQQILNHYISQLTQCYNCINKQQKEQSDNKIKYIKYMKKLYQNHKTNKILLKNLALLLLGNNLLQEVYNELKVYGESKSDTVDPDFIVLLTISSKDRQEELLNYKNALQVIKKQFDKLTIPEQCISKLALNISQALYRYQDSQQQCYTQLPILLSQIFITETDNPVIKKYSFNKAVIQLANKSIGDYYYRSQNYRDAIKYYLNITICRNSIVEKIAICFIHLGRNDDAIACLAYANENMNQNKVYYVEFVILNWIIGELCYDEKVYKIFSCDCLHQMRNRVRYGIFILKKLQQFNQSYSQSVQFSTVFSYLTKLTNQKKCCSVTTTKTFTVLTLNYSGVLTSPYQYYQLQNSKQLILNEAFARQVSLKYPDFRNSDTKFTWDMGTLDTKWKNRYSAFNMMRAGIKQNGKMMNQKQFMQTWQQYAQKTRDFIRKKYFEVKHKQNVQERMKIQIQRCRQFDLMCYQTFIRVIYGKDLSQIGDQDCQKYLQYREKDFTKPFLNENLKQLQTLKGLQTLIHDVLYMQEANASIIEALKRTNNYYVFQSQNIDSIILLNRKSSFFNFSGEIDFKQNNKIFLQKYSKIVGNTAQQARKQLNFNNDSILQIINQFVFLNVHLTSGKQKNPIQMASVKRFIKVVIKNMPEYILILGGDFNQRFNLSSQTSTSILMINPYPSNDSFNTVKKKRTLMQPQRRKAQILDAAPKDYLMSNLPIISGKCCQINGKDITSDMPLLPNKEHPYDHFLINAVFQVNTYTE